MTTPPVNVLPSWGTNKVAINYKLGWNSPDFVSYLQEWLRIPQNMHLVLETDDYTKIPARVLSLAILHRKCLVVSAKREGNGISVLRYDATVKSVGKGPPVHTEVVSMRDMQEECVRIMYPLVLEAAQELVAATPEFHTPHPPPQGMGQKAIVTLISDDGQELKGIFHPCEHVEGDLLKKFVKAQCEAIPIGKEILKDFVEYASDVRTLEFVAKGIPRSTANLAVIEILSSDPEAERRLGKSHRDLAKRHDVAGIYQTLVVAKGHVRSAILSDPYQVYKQQVFDT